MQGCLLRLSHPVLLVTAALATALAAGVPAASATSPAKAAVALAQTQPCAVSSSSALFAPWSDSNLYTPFPGSTFELGAQSWSFKGGAAIVSGDDNALLGTGGSHSLQIPGKGSATSPSLCVDSTMPSMRFFVRRVSGTGNLTVIGTLGHGKTSDSATLATLAATAIWTPTTPVVFPSTFAALTGDGSLSAQFLFTADAGSTFRIDDISMDPYRRT
jgi:hypothetical protein